MISRREFLRNIALLGGGLVLPSGVELVRAAVVTPAHPKTVRATVHGRVSRQTGDDPHPQAPLPGGTLDPLTVPKYVTPLVIPPAMPVSDTRIGANGELIDYYEIGVRQFEQNILPDSVNLPTTVWSYGSETSAGTYNYPAYTIEAQHKRPVRVKWVNKLVDSNNNYLPHLLTVDPTLHWANPYGPRDTRPTFSALNPPAPYTGPVPMVVHVHGGHTSDESDGYAEAWYLPAASNTPAEVAFTTGTMHDEFRMKAEQKYGETWTPGSAIFQYENDQRANTNWYHDHTLGMTRLNVYAGPAGFYLIRGGPDDLPDGILPDDQYEIPIVIQDRSFNSNGSLYYPDNRLFFDGFPGPYIPESDISPYWNPEFFGNFMVVNGKTWPVLEVEPRRYRLRFLNGCNSRFLILKLVDVDPGVGTWPLTSALNFNQIGAEGGFLDPAYGPVSLDSLLMAPAERADVILDFSNPTLAGKTLYMINEAPDEPYGGGVPGVDFPFADAQTTAQVMAFKVTKPLSTPDTSTPVASLVLPPIRKLPATNKIRKVSLMEMDSEVLMGVGPREAVLGIMDVNQYGSPVPVHKMWMDPITEAPLQGSTEVWEIWNFTMDAHPIHIHEVMFEVVERENRMDAMVRPPELWERGFKDTVIVYPGETTRVKAHFDLAGLYVWHCHIVEHEDNEMMRPYRVLHRFNLPLITK